MQQEVLLAINSLLSTVARSCLKLGNVTAFHCVALILSPTVAALNSLEMLFYLFVIF